MRTVADILIVACCIAALVLVLCAGVMRLFGPP